MYSKREVLFLVSVVLPMLFMALGYSVTVESTEADGSIQQCVHWRLCFIRSLADNNDDNVQRVQQRLSFQSGSVDGYRRYRPVRHAGLVHTRYSGQHSRVRRLGSASHATFVRMLPGGSCTRRMSLPLHAGHSPIAAHQNEIPLKRTKNSS